MRHCRICKYPALILAVAIMLSVVAPFVYAAPSSDFTYEAVNGRITITGYSGKALDITVPDKIGGLPVSAIGDNAFAGHETITGVKLPHSLSVIGYSAFSGCKALKSITLPTAVTAIGDYAFFSCTAITEITIPDTVSRIGYDAFSECSSLTEIRTGVLNTSFLSVSGVLYEKDGETLLCCPGGKHGYLTVPEGVTAIGDEAFAGCTGLYGVALPQTLASIGYWAFSGCSGITGISLPESLETIGASAFNGCTGLRSITLPRGVISAGINAFDGCTALNDILVSDDNLTYSSREGVLFDKSGIELIRCPSGKAGVYIIPNSVCIVSDWAFSGCSELTRISVPGSVFSIGEGAFVCGSTWAMEENSPVTGIKQSAMQSIDVDDNNRYYTSQDGVLYNGTQTVIIAVPAGKQGDFTIPGGVSTVANYAFACCTGLKTVSIPGTVSVIGQEAFECCTDLTEITIPAGVSGIGNQAFYRCANLTRATMENAMTRIGADAFKAVAEPFRIYYHADLSEQWADFTAYPTQAFCTVTIDLQDGSAISNTPTNVTQGKIMSPAAPVREGYAFDGWYKEAACKTAWDFSKDTVKSDIALFAKWIIAAPSTLHASVASFKSVSLSWSAVPGAAGYEVYRSSSASGTYTLIKSLTSMSYTATGLTAGKTYYYKVRAYRLNGTIKEYGAYTAVASARPGIATPRLLAASGSASSVKLTWTAVSGATGYEVWRCAAAAGSYSLIASPVKAEYSDSGLTAGKKSWYKVRAYRAANGKKVYGAYSGSISVQQ